MKRSTSPVNVSHVEGVEKKKRTLADRMHNRKAQTAMQLRLMEIHGYELEKLV